jgi:hypothetical protein
MASIITATTTSGLTQSADNSGVLQLASGAGNLVTVPAVTGTAMVSGNMPAFSATKITTPQTLSNSTFTKITFNSEYFDTNNNFASSTFTPTVAGYYQINAQIQCFATVGTTILISLYKNGVEYTRGVQLALSSGSMSLFHPSVNNIVYCNGSTDYLEIYGYITATSDRLVGESSATFFSGVLVRTA